MEPWPYDKHFTEAEFNALPVAQQKQILLIVRAPILHLEGETGLAAWPLGGISPKQIDVLTAKEREGLEEIAATYIKVVLQVRGVELPTGDPAD